jgi:hypothetical protein
MTLRLTHTESIRKSQLHFDVKHAPFEAYKTIKYLCWQAPFISKVSIITCMSARLVMCHIDSFLVL